MGLEEACVNCGDDGEEGYGIFVLRVREEGGSEAVPDGVDGEGEHELDCAACEERREDGVDGAVDVVEREDV